VSDRPFRLLVTGSRHLRDSAFVSCKLETLLQGVVRAGRPVVIVHGAEPNGADWWADRYAVSKGYGLEPHPADWQTLGKGAGPARNRAMVETRPDACVAFPAGESRGTRGCVFLAAQAGIPVQVYDLELDARGFVVAVRAWSENRPGARDDIVFRDPKGEADPAPKLWWYG
jgi:hypothetical protein